MLKTILTREMKPMTIIDNGEVGFKPVFGAPTTGAGVARTGVAEALTLAAPTPAAVTALTRKS